MCLLLSRKKKTKLQLWTLVFMLRITTNQLEHHRLEEYGILLTTKISTCDDMLEQELSVKLKARNWRRAKQLSEQSFGTLSQNNWKLQPWKCLIFWRVIEQAQKLTVLNEGLRPREPPMDSCHVQRAFPILTLTETKQNRNNHLAFRAVVTIWSLSAQHPTDILHIKPPLASEVCMTESIHDGKCRRYKHTSKTLPQQWLGNGLERSLSLQPGCTQYLHETYRYMKYYSWILFLSNISHSVIISSNPCNKGNKSKGTRKLSRSSLWEIQELHPVYQSAFYRYIPE